MAKDETRNFNIVFSAKDVTAVAFKSVADGAKRLTRELFSLKSVVSSALAGIGVGLGVSEFVKAAGQAELASNKLEAVLRATGNAAGFTKDELQDYAKQLEHATTFDDDEIVNAQAILATFTNVTGKNFKQATAAALDMSVVLGDDLQASFDRLGKALQDPEKGITQLTKAGVTFSIQQKALIQNLSETGRVAEAQQVILDQLKTQYGGAAQAAGGTFAGSLKALKNDFGDLEEVLGGLANGPLVDVVAAARKTVQDITGAVESLFRDWRNQVDLSVADILLKLSQVGDTFTAMWHDVVDVSVWAGGEITKVFLEIFNAGKRTWDDLTVNAKGFYDFVASGGKNYKFQSTTAQGVNYKPSSFPGGNGVVDSSRTTGLKNWIADLHQSINGNTASAINGANNGEDVNRNGPVAQMTERMWKELGHILNDSVGDFARSLLPGWLGGYSGPARAKVGHGSITLPQFQEAGTTTGLAAAAKERQMNNPLLEEARRQREEQKKTNGFLDKLPKDIADAMVGAVNAFVRFRSGAL